MTSCLAMGRKVNLGHLCARKQGSTQRLEGARFKDKKSSLKRTSNTMTTIDDRAPAR